MGVPAGERSAAASNGAEILHRPEWANSWNSEQKGRMIIKSACTKSGREKPDVVWGTRVDDWLLKRGFGVLPELAKVGLLRNRI